MARFLFGLCAPVLIVFVIWVFGTPPATSIFWATKSAVVVGHETFEAETGYGVYPFHVPIVRYAGAEDPVRLSLPGAPAMDTVQSDWPLQQQVTIKLAPSGAMAYAVNDRRRAIIAPLIVLVLGGLVVGLTVLSYFRALDGAALFCGAIGLVFTVIPPLVLAARWQTGNPPPLAHVVWQTKTVPIVERDIISARIGNGTIRHTPVVRVQLQAGAEPVQVGGYLGSSRAQAERIVEGLGGDAVMKVNVSPQGEPFEARWDLQQVITVVLTVLSPLFLLIGLIFLRLALPIGPKAERG